MKNTRRIRKTLNRKSKAELDTLASTIQRNVDADKQHKVKVKEVSTKLRVKKKSKHNIRY